MKEFLQNSFLYIQGFVPAREVILSYFHVEQGKQVFLADASAKGCTVLNQELILPEHIRPFTSRSHMETILIKEAKSHPTARPWIQKGLLDKNASLLVSRLLVRDDLRGTVIFTAPQGVVFTQRHAYLITMIRQPFAIALSNVIQYRELMGLKELLAEDYRDLQNDYMQVTGPEIVGERLGLKNVIKMMHQVAPLSSPVLLLGESGTGKEVIAGAIHRHSPREKGPFVTVNCGAIPENLIDSELFGYEKGAFIGAGSRKRGRFERADNGTIFLDEIGELKPET